MIGKTIESAMEGYMGDDEALILKMTDGTMFLLKSYSTSSDGGLSCDKIEEVPTKFKEAKLYIL